MCPLILHPEEKAGGSERKSLAADPSWLETVALRQKISREWLSSEGSSSIPPGHPIVTLIRMDVPALLKQIGQAKL